jgi:hypothetical protein
VKYYGRQLGKRRNAQRQQAFPPDLAAPLWSLKFGD